MSRRCLQLSHSSASLGHLFTYMISRLLSLNPDEKLLFKSDSDSGIARLFSQPDIQLSETAYWERFLSIFDSTSDVFSIFSLSDINKTIQRHPENLRTLVLFLFQNLHNLARKDQHFCPVPNQLQDDNRSSSFAGGWITSTSRIMSSDKAKESTSSQKLKQALNCIRLLTRLVPLILENQDQHSGITDPSPSCADQSLEQLIFNMQTTPNTTVEEEQLGVGGNSEGRQSNDAVEQIEEQFVIQDEDDDDVASTANSPSEVLKDPLGATAKEVPKQQVQAATREEEEETPTSTLGQDLLSLTVDLLFFSGFTIPWTLEHLETFRTSASDSSSRAGAPSKVNPTIWFTGIGSTISLPIPPDQTSKYYMENRIEVLRLLLTLMSKTMYIEPHLQSSSERQNMILRSLACDLDRDRVLKLLCSLLNLVATLAKHDGIGSSRERENNWLGIGALPNLPNPNVALGMSINPNVNKDANSSQDLLALSLKILNVLLYFEPLNPLPAGLEGPSARASAASNQTLPIPQPPSFSRSSSNQSQTSTASASRTPTNLFKHYLSKLHLPKDFSFVFDSLIAVLNQPFSSSGVTNLLTSLPAISSSQNSSNPQPPNSSEALLLLWRLITCNKKFRSFVVESGQRSQLLLGQLLNYGLYSKDSFQLSGLTRLCVFILQDLSSSQSFSENISLPNSLLETKKNISARHLRLLGSEGSNSSTAASDLMIQVIYSLIATTKSTLASLYIPLILIITNTSVNFKKLSIRASNRLFSLFRSFSHPNFLLSDESSFKILFHLVEAFNNVVRVNPKDNLNFIYAILKNRENFEKLERFSLRNGLGEIRRLRGFKNQTLNLDRAGAEESDASANRTLGGATENISAEEEKAVLARKDQEASELSSAEAPLTSQTDEEIAMSLQNEEKSEKTKGKMRKISITGLNGDDLDQISPPLPRSSALRSTPSDSTDALIEGMNEHELYQAAETIGRNGFVATEAWVNRWQKELPLPTIQALLKSLVPKVEEFSISDSVANKINADERVLAFLKEVDWTDVLKTDSSLSTKAQTRHFIHNQQSRIWVLSYLWGLIFTSNLYPLGIFSHTNARLFLLKSADKSSAGLGLGGSGRMAGQFVGQIWEGLGGLMSLSSSGRNSNLSSPVLTPQERPSGTF